MKTINTKPEPETTGNYIIIRVKNPDLFQAGSFRTIDISKKEGIKATIGKLKGETTTTVQRYLFLKTKWTLSEAQAWVKEHAKKYDGINPEWLEDEIMEKQLKYFKAEVKSVDEKNHTIDAAITTNQKDRDNEIIQTSAWKENIQSYLQHPVLLSSHNYGDLRKQIGQALSINFNENDIVVKFNYYVGEGNPEADWAWILASKGIAMFSVGFQPTEWLTDDEIKQQYIDDENPPRRVYTKAELLEVSQVLVGSNRGALQLDISNPNPEQCQYMYDVVKSLGDKIPDFNPEPEIIKTEQKTEIIPPVKTDEIILPFKLDFKSIKEAEQVINILKSGRVLSEKNRNLIKNSVDVLQNAIKSLTELLEATQIPVDEETEAGKMKEMIELKRKIDKLLEKVKCS